MQRLLALSALALALTGCGSSEPQASPSTPQVQVNGETIPLTPGEGLSYDQTVTETTDGSLSTFDSGGSASGAGLSTSAAEQAASFNSEAPTISLGRDEPSGSGGGLLSDWSLKTPKGNPLWIFGFLLLCASGFAVYKAPVWGWRPAMIGGACTAACFAAAALPAYALFFIAAAAVAGVVVYFKAESGAAQAPRFKEALRATVAGVESLPDDARKQAKSEISKQADEADRVTIREVKKEDDLPSERQ